MSRYESTFRFLIRRELDGRDEKRREWVVKGFYDFIGGEDIEIPNLNIERKYIP